MAENNKKLRTLISRLKHVDDFAELSVYRYILAHSFHHLFCGNREDMRFYGKLFLFFFFLCVVFIFLVLFVTLSPRGARSYKWPIDDPKDWFQNFV